MVRFALLFLVLNVLFPKQLIKPSEKEALINQLKKGGYVIYFRHEATEHVEVDISQIDINDCTTQRNLSEKGRKRAILVGKALRKLNIPIGDIESSPFCRSKDTAQLIFNRLTRISTDLYFAFPLTKAEKEKLSESLRKKLNQPPPKGKNTIIVSHSSNLKEALNIWPKTEGGAYIFKPSENTTRFLGELLPEDWIQLASKHNQ